MIKTEGDKFSAQDHFFIFALFVLMELWVCVQGENQCSCLHTLWFKLLFHSFSLGKMTELSLRVHRIIVYLWEAFRLTPKGIGPMRKTSTAVANVFPYYLRETRKEWSGSSLQVLENNWTKRGQWVFHSPHLPNIENTNLNKIFL